MAVSVPKPDSTIDFALDSAADRVHAITRIESLLGPDALNQIRRVSFGFVDQQSTLSVTQLRLVLQLEDHLDWLLRHDQPRLQLWRLDSRRPNALALSIQVANIWQALGVCLGRYALGAGEWVKTPEEETGLLPLTIAIALHCHVNEMRWRARGEQGCDVPLHALHRLYKIAETRNVAEQEVRPYEADVDFSVTPKGQYVVMLLMADLAERDLPPVQRLIAQHWLSSWARDVVLDNTKLAGVHSMLVNLDSHEGILRVAENVLPAYRYLDIRAIARRIEETDAHLANSNTSDETTRDTPEATETDYAETLAWLEKLYHDRSAAFQATRERKAVAADRYARVVIGWNQIQAFIEAANWKHKGARGTFPDTQPSTPQALGEIGEALSRSAVGATAVADSGDTPRERCDDKNFALWQVRDLSVGGVGLSSDHGADADLAVGTLVLVEMDGEPRWSLGRIVRKFKGLDGGDVRFGIQLLGGDATPVRLTPRASDELNKNPLISAVTGLFLGSIDNPGTQDLLLISASALACTRRYELKTGAKRSPIRTTLPVQSAGAWVLIQFEDDA
jgi:hypothetical protein